MATPQKERESFEKGGCQSCDTGADIARTLKIKRTAKKIAKSKIPNAKVGKMRAAALERLSKQI